MPTDIMINGQKIYGGNLKYMRKGGVIPNQTFQNGLPYNGYVPDIPSDTQYINAIPINEVCGEGIFDFIPILGPILNKLTGQGLEGEEMKGGFPFLAAIPAVLSGIELLSGLFKGKGMTKEARICDMMGEPCDIEFRHSKKGTGLYKTKAKFNGMHKALLRDMPFLEELAAHGTSFGRGTSFGQGTSFPGGDLLSQVPTATELERSKEAGEESQALLGLQENDTVYGNGYNGMKNINSI